jgi:hypothetical protein
MQRLGGICPISDFVHFQDLASRNSNFEPVGNLGKLLIFTFFCHFTRIKKRDIQITNLETFDRWGKFLTLIMKFRAVPKINNFCPLRRVDTVGCRLQFAMMRQSKCILPSNATLGQQTISLAAAQIFKIELQKLPNLQTVRYQNRYITILLNYKGKMTKKSKQ